MKKITILLLLLLNFVSGFAQEINDSMVTTWFGSGSNKAYLVIDFNDGTPNESLLWGFKFNNTDSPTVYNMLQILANEQDCFSFEATSGFLDTLFFMDKGDDSGSDWWKTWSGANYSSLAMNGGISSRVVNDYVYALSYGFMCGAICDAPPSFPIAAANCSALSTPNVLDHEINLYPNPVKDIIFIDLENNIQIENVSIIDLNGKILKATLKNNSVNIQDLATGIYFINLDTNKGRLTKKIIKK